jgi:hypothetical protein
MSTRLLSWQQHGEMSLWRYVNPSHSYRGLHLSADAVACESLLQLIQFLSESIAGDYRTVVVSPPTERLLGVVNNRSASVESMSKLRLGYSPALDCWDFVSERQVGTLLLGEIWLTKLADAIKSMAAGEGDFCIGPTRSEDRLWFWWWRK